MSVKVGLRWMEWSHDKPAAVPSEAILRRMAARVRQPAPGGAGGSRIPVEFAGVRV